MALPTEAAAATAALGAQPLFLWGTQGGELGEVIGKGSDCCRNRLLTLMGADTENWAGIRRRSYLKKPFPPPGKPT